MASAIGASAPKAETVGGRVLEIWPNNPSGEHKHTWLGDGRFAYAVITGKARRADLVFGSPSPRGVAGAPSTIGLLRVDLARLATQLAKSNPYAGAYLEELGKHVQAAARACSRSTRRSLACFRIRIDLMMRTYPIILGTAGHIDHGKTSLVRALTGIDTDRLKRRRAGSRSSSASRIWMWMGGAELVDNAGARALPARHGGRRGRRGRGHAGHRRRRRSCRRLANTWISVGFWASRAA